MTPPSASLEGVVSQLADLIAARAKEPVPVSYTGQLLAQGHQALAAKIVEDAYALVEAAAEGNPATTIGSTSDLLFHMLVLLEHAGIPWKQVERDLWERFGNGQPISGSKAGPS